MVTIINLGQKSSRMCSDRVGSSGGKDGSHTLYMPSLSSNGSQPSSRSNFLAKRLKLRDAVINSMNSERSDPLNPPPPCQSRKTLHQTSHRSGESLLDGSLNTCLRYVRREGHLCQPWEVTCLFSISRRNY